MSAIYSPYLRVLRPSFSAFMMMSKSNFHPLSIEISMHNSRRFLQNTSEFRSQSSKLTLEGRPERMSEMLGCNATATLPPSAVYVRALLVRISARIRSKSGLSSYTSSSTSSSPLSFAFVAYTYASLSFG